MTLAIRLHTKRSYFLVSRMVDNIPHRSTQGTDVENRFSLSCGTMVMTTNRYTVSAPAMLHSLPWRVLCRTLKEEVIVRSLSATCKGIWPRDLARTWRTSPRAKGYWHSRRDDVEHTEGTEMMDPPHMPSLHIRAAERHNGQFVVE